MCLFSRTNLLRLQSVLRTVVSTFSLSARLPEYGGDVVEVRNVGCVDRWVAVHEANAL